MIALVSHQPNRFTRYLGIAGLVTGLAGTTGAWGVALMSSAFTSFKDSAADFLTMGSSLFASSSSDAMLFWAMSRCWLFAAEVPISRSDCTAVSPTVAV